MAQPQETSLGLWRELQSKLQNKEGASQSADGVLICKLDDRDVQYTLEEPKQGSDEYTFSITSNGNLTFEMVGKVGEEDPGLESVAFQTLVTIGSFRDSYQYTFPSLIRRTANECRRGESITVDPYFRGSDRRLLKCAINFVESAPGDNTGLSSFDNEGIFILPRI